MKFVSYHQVTGRGEVLVYRLDNKEMPIKGTTILHGTKLYSIRNIECAKPLMGNKSVKDVALVVKPLSPTDTYATKKSPVFFTMEDWLEEKTRSIINGQKIPKEIETILFPNEKGDIVFLQISCLDTTGIYEPLEEGGIYAYNLLKDKVSTNTLLLELTKIIFTEMDFNNARLIRYYFTVLSKFAT